QEARAEREAAAEYRQHLIASGILKPAKGFLAEPWWLASRPCLPLDALGAAVARADVAAWLERDRLDSIPDEPRGGGGQAMSKDHGQGAGSPRGGEAVPSGRQLRDRPIPSHWCLPGRDSLEAARTERLVRVERREVTPPDATSAAIAEARSALAAIESG